MRPTYYPVAVVGLSGACLLALGVASGQPATSVGGIVLGAATLGMAVIFAAETFLSRWRDRADRAPHLAERIARQADRSEETRAARRYRP